MFTLAISCLTTSNSPWFMDLTLQVPIQYCSLQHRSLLPSTVTSTTQCCCCFGSASPLFLEVFPHSSPVAFQVPTDLGSSSFSVLWFWPFHTVHGVPKARILKWFAIPFSSGSRFVRTLHRDPSIHLGWPYTAWLKVSLSWRRLWSTWLARFVFCDCGFHSVCPLRDKDKRLMELSWWEKLWGKLGLLLMGGAGPCSVNL